MIGSSSSIWLALLAAEPPQEIPSAEFVSSAPMIVLHTCIIRRWSRMGQLVDLPMANGASFDWWPKIVSWVGPGEPAVTIKIIDEGHIRRVIAVGHRNWKGPARKMLAETSEKCAAEIL